VSEDAPEPSRRYQVETTDRAAAEREDAFLNLLRYSPEYAGRWLKGLNRALTNLPDFPGPRSHAVDPEATALFGRETRRMLYFGPTRRRSGIPYRVLFTVIEPTGGETHGVIRVLRIVHGAQLLGQPDATDENP
jgi:plasmid stabilization system protein ParE